MDIVFQYDTRLGIMDIVFQYDTRSFTTFTRFSCRGWITANYTRLLRKYDFTISFPNQQCLLL